jgi:hypothetical protein
MKEEPPMRFQDMDELLVQELLPQTLGDDMADSCGEPDELEEDADKGDADNEEEE